MGHTVHAEQRHQPATSRAMRRRQASTRQRPVKLTAAQASTRLRDALRAHAREAIEWSKGERSTPAPVLAVKASAGLGKSQAVLEVLAQPEWQGLRVLYLVPSIELGEELRDRSADLNVDARVMRGRSQPKPGEAKDGERMCQKHDLAEALAALGTDVANTLCRSKPATKGGQAEECEHAATCPYLRQMRDKAPGLLIAAHQYIPLTLEGLKADNIDLLIVDESFWQAMCREGRVSTSQFQLHRMPGEFSKAAFRKGESKAARDERLTEDAADHADLVNKVRGILREAQDKNRPLDLQAFRDAGLTPENCRWAASYEYGRLGKPSVTAGMSRDEQEQRIRAAVVDEAFGFARVWKILAAELEQPRGQLIGLLRDARFWNEKKAIHQDVLRTFFHPEAKLAGVPMVLIDADLDEGIASQFYPVARKVVTLEADWSNVRVRQVVDRAVSKNMLAGSNPRTDEQQRHGNRRDDLLAMAEDMAARHGHPMMFSTDAREDVTARRRRPLLATFKGVEDVWVAEERIEGGGDPSHTPKRNALPFAVAHLGDLRGKDGWKEATGIIVAGRLEPGVAAMEALARCVFYADPGELAFVAPDDKGNLRYGIEERPILFRDGTELPVPVAVHPDARVQAVLEQVREAELLQAVARIRPVHRRANQPCEIIVASNIPLPGLMVDEGVEWSDLTPDRIRRMELAGVLPDLASDCAAAYPNLFPSAEAVRQTRSRAARARLGVVSSDIDLGCDKAHLGTLYGKCHTLEEGAPAPSSRMTRMGMVRVEYRRPEGSIEGNRGVRFRAGGAFVRCRPGEAEADVVARLLEALPDAVKVAVVGAIPCPVEQPEEAQAALESALAFIRPWLDTDDVLRRFPKEAVAMPGSLLAALPLIHGGGSCLIH